MLGLLIMVLLAYLVGSVSGSLVIGKIRHVDIRESGSGNAGGTNALRTQGFLFALGVVIIDIGKGSVAAGLIPKLQFLWPAMSMDQSVVAMFCGFAAVVGHCYPVWHGFRGGKGAATAVGALLVIQPAVVIPMLLVWLAVLTVTGWVGLATMLAALSLIPAVFLLDGSAPAVIFAAVMGFFIVFTHRSNIRHMLEGSEYRFEKARIKNWFSGAG